ncbi:hypothetical protein BHE90_017446 [Fusarium euwallaceae]|uniref:Cyanovirin-N domain-containing protein n=1 Tax=Fusarium euwallaceae TaxID=1147111 RepID=A0A430KXE3_9HYPO|nr:hypothetical protein BHE90_017446 [Fusarium euwallaceae]
MKAVTILVALSGLLLGANADSHGACGCQINSDGTIDTDATQTCCQRFGGTSTYLSTSGKVRFAGEYCLKNNIDGDSFYNCCRQFLSRGDSACPW